MPYHRLQVALCVDEEVRRHYHRVSGRHDFPDLGVALAARADLYDARFEVALTAVEQQHLALAGVDDGVVRDCYDGRRLRRGDLHVGVHVGQERAIGVRHFDAHAWTGSRGSPAGR